MINRFVQAAAHSDST